MHSLNKRRVGILQSRHCPNGLLIKPWLVFRVVWGLGEEREGKGALVLAGRKK